MKIRHIDFRSHQLQNSAGYEQLENNSNAINSSEDQENTNYHSENGVANMQTVQKKIRENESILNNFEQLESNVDQMEYNSDQFENDLDHNNSQNEALEQNLENLSEEENVNEYVSYSSSETSEDQLNGSFNDNEKVYEDLSEEEDSSDFGQATNLEDLEEYFGDAVNMVRKTSILS